MTDIDGTRLSTNQEARRDAMIARFRAVGATEEEIPVRVVEVWKTLYRRVGDRWERRATVKTSRGARVAQRPDGDGDAGPEAFARLDAYDGVLESLAPLGVVFLTTREALVVREGVPYLVGWSEVAGTPVLADLDASDEAAAWAVEDYLRVKWWTYSRPLSDAAAGRLNAAALAVDTLIR